VLHRLEHVQQVLMLRQQSTTFRPFVQSASPHMSASPAEAAGRHCCRGCTDAGALVIWVTTTRCLNARHVVRRRKKGCKRAASVRFCIEVDGATTCCRLLLLPEDADLAASARALLSQVNSYTIGVRGTVRREACCLLDMTKTARPRFGLLYPARCRASGPLWRRSWQSTSGAA
jgi:hypothetical protein